MTTPPGVPRAGVDAGCCVESDLSGVKIFTRPGADPDVPTHAKRIQQSSD